MEKVYRAPRGDKLHCKGWIQEAAYRMIQNNLDPDVAEKPQELIVYGGTGKAARSHKELEKILGALLKLENNQTLLVQSGKAVGVIETHPDAPRVLIANSNLVPHWANWKYFRELERLGLIMYGQMTAGSWIYIGTQGILQGTYETFSAAAHTHFKSDLTGRLVVSAGLGGMGGAQPLAVTMNNGVFLGAEINPERLKKRKKTKYLDIIADSIEEAIDLAINYKKGKKPISIGVCANATELHRALIEREIVPDIVTDQTAAHDLLNGYYPEGFSYEEAEELRKKDPDEYLRRARDTVRRHVEYMNMHLKNGSHVFDYGNNIRTQAKEAGLEDAYQFPGFVQAYIRPLFCDGMGPFRWVALSGDPQDIYTTDKELMNLFHEKKSLIRWLKLAGERVAFQGLPARICWLGYGERDRAGLLFNYLVKKGKIRAPIVIGRDHLDCGSVASPFRETEGMKDGSDAIADWPILNALINTACGASWVSFHHGGGVGIGYSLHAGMVIVADGTEDAEKRLERVLKADPATGIIRHVDAGYQRAESCAKEKDVKIPGLNF